MPNRFLLFILAVFVLLIAACTTGRKSPTGFRLPAGDAERGKVAFMKYDCNTCHEVAGADLPKPTALPAVPVMLGGPIDVEKSDGYLVTSIINPSHQIARGPRELLMTGFNSRMPAKTEKMTVSELTDIVEFVQSHYVVRRAPLTSGYY